MKKQSYAAIVFENDNYKENCEGGCWTCLEQKKPKDGDIITCVIMGPNGKALNKREVIFSEMSDCGTHGLIFDEKTESVHILPLKAPWHPEPFSEGKLKSMCNAMIASIGPAAMRQGFLDVQEEG